MKVKKYVASTMAEALSQIKQDLGSDAIILHNKNVKVGGVFGLFKKNKLEVIAALDENPLPTRVEQYPVTEATQAQNHTSLQSHVDEGQQKVLQEIEQLRKVVMTQARYNSIQFKAPFDSVFSVLLEQEVFPSVAEDIVTEMEKQYETKEQQESDFTSYIIQFIQTALESTIQDTTTFHKKVIQFIGPTGVGKTTTIAKVAAKTMLEQNRSVAFITTDTYRIAAVEQIKTYAKILGVPLEVAYTQADYIEALEKFSTYDHIFVDTAGRNYRENNYVEDLEEIITFHRENHETYIVLSLTAKAQDNIDVFRVFYKKGIKQVIFTKLDETTTFGSVINLCLGEDAQIAYISNGQNVPEDVIMPDATNLATLIIGGYFNE